MTSDHALLDIAETIQCIQHAAGFEIVCDFGSRVNKEIIAMKADWTNQDDTIAKALAAYGRQGVPLYVYYAAGSNTSEIFPQILSIGIMKDKL